MVRLVAWSALCVVALFGGCSLVNQYDEVPEGAPCASVQDCDDQNPCTVEVCGSDGFCEVTPFDEGTPGLVQPPFDCQSLVCQGGLIVSIPDDGDVPTAPCLDASCTDGTLTSMPRPEGTPCTVGAGQGTCDAMGECIVTCTMPADPACDDAEACTNDSCDTERGVCVHEPLDGVAPAPDPNLAGDCTVVSCVQGVTQTVVNQQDVPQDNNDCTDDLCDAAGNPSNPPRPVDTACGTLLNLLCDGAGTCANCNSNDDCGADTQCLQYLCQSNNCLSNPLTGQACNDGVWCNGSDTCDANGNCTVNAGNPCPGPDGDGDCSETCREANDDCNGNDTNNSACTDGNLCTAGDSCQTGTCTAGPNPCAAAQIDTDGDCSEACSSSTGLCTENDPTPHACNDGNLCTTGETCSGGNCQGGTNPCAAAQIDNDADCSEACAPMTGLCTETDPTPHPCNDGNLCTLNETCQAGICVPASIVNCGGPCVVSCASGGCNPGTGVCGGAYNHVMGKVCEIGATCAGLCNGMGACN